MIKYPNYVLNAIRQNLGLEQDDTSQDKIIEKMSKDEVLDRVCNWEGLIDYGEKIRNWFKDIYNDDTKILLEKPLSNHPADGHFKVVLAKIKDKEYVTWEYNGHTDSYYWGHYYGNNQEGAIKDYLERGSYHEKSY